MLIEAFWRPEIGTPERRQTHRAWGHLQRSSRYPYCRASRQDFATRHTTAPSEAVARLAPESRGTPSGRCAACALRLQDRGALPHAPSSPEGSPGRVPAVAALPGSPARGRREAGHRPARQGAVSSLVPRCGPHQPLDRPTGAGWHGQKKVANRMTKS